MQKSGFVFTPYDAPDQTPFDTLFDVFMEIITHTSGDMDEAMEWMNVIDQEYKLTTEDYTMDDFIEDLKKKGYLREEIQGDGKGITEITAKTERTIRKKAMDQLFGKIRKQGAGSHKSKKSGQGDGGHHGDDDDNNPIKHRDAYEDVFDNDNDDDECEENGDDGEKILSGGSDNNAGVLQSSCLPRKPSSRILIQPY